jgi:hypothetical protein
MDVFQVGFVVASIFDASHRVKGPGLRPLFSEVLCPRAEARGFYLASLARGRERIRPSLVR